MKRSLFAILLAVSLFAVTGCSSVAPGPGTEAVLIRKPMLFGSGGIDPTPIQPGRKFVAWTTDAVYVEMRPVQVAVSFDDLMSKDGVPIDFDAAVRYQVTDSVKLVSQFGADEQFFGRNLDRAFRDAVRDAVKKRGMNETAIDATASEEIDAEVTRATEAVVAASGLPIRLIDVTLGRANPPDAVKSQRIDTAAQEQRVNTERQRKLAEDQRLAAEQSRAAADNAYREAMRLDPDQFLTLESIKIMGSVCMSKPGTCSFVTAGGLPTFGIR